MKEEAVVKKEWVVTIWGKGDWVEKGGRAGLLKLGKVITSLLLGAYTFRQHTTHYRRQEVSTQPCRTL